MSAAAIQIIREDRISANTIQILDCLPAFPWKDPFSVSPEELEEIISSLKNACAQNPANAGLHIFLGMAHAMNCSVYESMDAFEQACRIAPLNFFARYKYSELFFRLRIMDRAEEESARALALANRGAEVALVRKQLSEIRRLKRQGVERTAWTKSLKVSAIGIAFILFVISLAYMVWK